MEKENVKELIQIIKETDEEIESLFILRKVSLENTTKLLEIKKMLKKEIIELKETCENSSKDDAVRYQCDKCEHNFKTAGLLRRHIKNEHDKFALVIPGGYRGDLQKIVLICQGVYDSLRFLTVF